MKRWMGLLTLACVLSLALPSDAWAQVHGVFRVVKGQVQVKSGKNGKIERAKIGQKVFPKDTIITGKDSRAKVVMVDKNEINISPESNLEIEDYEFEPEKGKKNVLLNVIYGKVRSKVNQKYDGENAKFQVKTKSAVAGVRGTDFLAGFDRQTQKSQVVTFEGEVAYGQPGPNGSIKNPVSVGVGQMADVAGNGPPSSPRSVPPQVLAKMDNESNADKAGSSDADKRQPAADKKDDDKKKKQDSEKGDKAGNKKDGDDKKKSDGGDKGAKKDGGDKKQEGDKNAKNDGSKGGDKNAKNDGDKNAKNDGSKGGDKGNSSQAKDGNKTSRDTDKSNNSGNKGNSAGNTAGGDKGGKSAGGTAAGGGSTGGTAGGGKSDGSSAPPGPGGGDKTAGGNQQANNPGPGPGPAPGTDRNPAAVDPAAGGDRGPGAMPPPPPPPPTADFDFNLPGGPNLDDINPDVTDNIDIPEDTIRDTIENGTARILIQIQNGQ